MVSATAPPARPVHEGPRGQDPGMASRDSSVPARTRPGPGPARKSQPGPSRLGSDRGTGIGCVTTGLTTVNRPPIASSREAREVRSQPPLCGKVQNHAASTDVGQHGPTWRCPDYIAFLPCWLENYSSPATDRRIAPGRAAYPASPGPPRCLSRPRPPGRRPHRPDAPAEGLSANPAKTADPYTIRRSRGYDRGMTWSEMSGHRKIEGGRRWGRESSWRRSWPWA